MYTDQFIDQLINCPKLIVDGPKNSTQSRGSLKKTFTKVSDDSNKFSFSGFITVNNIFNENFSIGLVYNPKNEKGSFALLRCNGLHGGNLLIPHHAFCHIHLVSSEDINAGIKVERNITKTEEYSTCQDAIQFYIKK